MTAQLNRLIRGIEDRLPRHESVEAAARDLVAELRAFGVAIDERFESEINAAVEAVNARLGPIEVLRRNSLVKPREQWYQGPSPRDLHWPAVRDYIANSKGWEKDAIRSLDESSTEVVSLLANPRNPEFRCRGLVVGYVQSGKTANMTGVIAKAVDAGYNLVVLLAGTTNKLRTQTQARIEADVVKRHRHHWQLYTTVDHEGDFTIPANRGFTMPRPGMAQLAVMKKETTRLEAFRDTIKKTPRAILERLRVLLIDDECDQASVNAARRENDITQINKHIREIISAFPGVSYVGYTATPFANVFIDPFPYNKDQLDDLYPEDFITALPRPKDYFGAREVFGGIPDDADSDEDTGKHMIRIISDNLDNYRPKSAGRDSFAPVMGDSLRDAILWFLVTCAVRRARGQGDKHMTMLVHTSPNIVPHERTAKLISDWLSVHGPKLSSGQGPEYEALRKLTERETLRVPPTGPFPDELQLRALLKESIDAVQVVVENSVSLERLEYSREARTYIVVGGSVLSRGLTLEGLTVSFFLRTSRQYDTLLQMGRWFGYRHGYEDLPRLWTTAKLAKDFRALAAIEEEIREDIAQYRERNCTPLDFAVRVRSIPGMAITSASKMRNAYRTNISFDGRHVQTIRFDHQDIDTVTGNWRAGARLITDIMEYRVPGAGAPFFTGVPFPLVRQFLQHYRICEEHMDLKEKMLLAYLDVASEKLSQWNVGLVIAEGSPSSELPLGALGVVGTVRRAQLKDTGTTFADIKALMSKRDILIDAEDKTFSPGEKWDSLKLRRPPVPLLLLYPINKTSKAQPGSRTRTALNAVGDLLGIGIVFPGRQDRSGNFYSVQLDSFSPEDLEAEEAELSEPSLE